MSKEIVILYGSWIILAALLMILTPKEKIREAFLIFFFKQLITWIIGLLVAQYDLIDYPIRSFPKATKSSFDFEYFIYPAICVFFNLYYPVGKTWAQQLLHYVYYCTSITIIEGTLEKHTDLINYKHWTWYLTWITLLISFYISRHFYVWYFRLNQQTREEG